MSWREFTYFINGLSGDSPLGRIIAIRAEDSPEQLKQFTPQQRKIRDEYRKKAALRKTDEECESAYARIEQAFLKMAR